MDHLHQSSIVLVVEDQPLLRLEAHDLIEEIGFTPLEAANAAEAMDVLEGRSDIRVVFTDITMPGSMDGLRLAATIRDRWPPIELIVTSAEVQPDLAGLPVRAVFLPKPYCRHDIAAAIRQFA